MKPCVRAAAGADTKDVTKRIALRVHECPCRYNKASRASVITATGVANRISSPVLAS